MAHDVIKQKMLMNTEDVRKCIKKVKPSNPLQNCEVEMARTCLDSIVQYIRQNKDNMTPQQITEVNELLVRLQNSILIWGNDKFMFQQEKLEISPILKNMEQKLDNAADQGR
jgi:hypothetical protein